MKPVKIWRCDYCDATRETEAQMFEHEANCAMNPDIKCCLSCFHYLKEDRITRPCQFIEVTGQTGRCNHSIVRECNYKWVLQEDEAPDVDNWEPDEDAEYEKEKEHRLQNNRRVQ
jgi:hypothetical protein